MLDMAATAPAAHIILGEKEEAVSREAPKELLQTSTARGAASPSAGDRDLSQSHGG